MFFKSFDIIDHDTKEKHLTAAFIKGVPENLKIFLSGKIFPDFDHCVDEAIQWSEKYSPSQVDPSQLVHHTITKPDADAFSRLSKRIDELQEKLRSMTLTYTPKHGPYMTPRRGPPAPQGNFPRNRFCTHCGRTSHFAAECTLLRRSLLG